MMRNEEILFQAHEINKSFGVTRALVDLDLVLLRGQIHGLIGENGSGKSTLASIIAGAQKADSGTMELRGDAYAPLNMPDAAARGVSLIIQEQGTFGAVSVAANIFSGRESRFVRGGLLDVGARNREARKALDQIDAVSINEKTVTSQLSFEERKFLEVARAVYSDPCLLIVDETTAVLSKEGRDVLYSIMHKKRDEGNTVLFITHSVEELIEHSDQITVLRDGELVKTLSREEFDPAVIKELMIGRKLEESYYRSDTVCSHDDDVRLRARNLYYRQIKNVSFDVHKGEIFGIGGLSDCGMHPLGKLLYGALPVDAGTVEVMGKGKNTSPGAAIRNRCAYVAKDRDQESLMRTMTIRENICLLSFKKIEKLGLLFKRAEKRFTQTWREKLDIRMRDTEQYVMHLSGGNKQKVALARWIAFDPDVYIMDCPTRGIDVGAKAEIMRLIREFKEQGKAIVVISEELPELIGLCDRVMILKNGESMGIFDRSADLTEGLLINYML